MTVPLIIFWLSLCGLTYIYLGYPALIGLLARCRRRPPRRGEWTEPVSIVMVVHNEAGTLPQKLASLRQPGCDELVGEILIVSDGSDDGTDELINAEAATDARIRLIAHTERRGKPANLNDAIPQCRHAVVVLTDARQELAPQALRELCANFADPQVGVVSGELVFREREGATTASAGIGFYWRYEKWIRRQESEYFAVPGATGAFYAIRRELFAPIPDSALLDDVQIPMQAVTQGARCVFEPAAVIFDRPSTSPKQESIRKRRTIAGTAQLMLHHPGWVLPWKNRIWCQYVSHKLFRLMSPLLLVAVMASNVALAMESRTYTVLLVLHCGMYAAAGLGWGLQRAGVRSAVFGPPLMFLSLNLTTAFALCDAARGRFRVTWQKSA